MSFLSVLRAAWALTPAVRELVVLIAEEVNRSPSPERSALRALEEASRLRRFDEAIKRQRGESPN